MNVVKAWDSGKDSDFESLYYLEGSPDEIRKMVSMGWKRTKQLKDPKLEIVEYIDLQEIKKRIASGAEHSEQLKRIVELSEQKRTLNKVEYESNLPLLGILIYKIESKPSEDHAFHNGTSFHPVGLKDEKLFIPSMRRTK
jgi:hypothetical protein